VVGLGCSRKARGPQMSEGPPVWACCGVQRPLLGNLGERKKIPGYYPPNKSYRLPLAHLAGPCCGCGSCCDSWCGCGCGCGRAASRGSAPGCGCGCGCGCGSGSGRAARRGRGRWARAPRRRSAGARARRRPPRAAPRPRATAPRARRRLGEGRRSGGAVRMRGWACCTLSLSAAVAAGAAGPAARCTAARGAEPSAAPHRPPLLPGATAPPRGQTVQRPLRPRLACATAVGLPGEGMGWAPAGPRVQRARRAALAAVLRLLLLPSRASLPHGPMAIALRRSPRRPRPHLTPFRHA
jgi:hypothetical protein